MGYSPWGRKKVRDDLVTEHVSTKSIEFVAKIHIYTVFSSDPHKQHDFGQVTELSWPQCPLL